MAFVLSVTLRSKSVVVSVTHVDFPEACGADAVQVDISYPLTRCAGYSSTRSRVQVLVGKVEGVCWRHHEDR